LAAAGLSGVSPAAAQDRLVTTFVPEAHRRWDATGFVGWRGVDKSALAPDWNDWYDVAAFSASAGRYLTPHVKIDVDLSTTSNGRVGEILRHRRHRHSRAAVPRLHHAARTRDSSGRPRATHYQFLETVGASFLGASVEGVRQSGGADTAPPGGLAVRSDSRDSGRYRPGRSSAAASSYVSERASFAPTCGASRRPALNPRSGALAWRDF
jgi:hypothetical protein